MKIISYLAVAAVLYSISAYEPLYAQSYLNLQEKNSQMRTHSRFVLASVDSDSSSAGEAKNGASFGPPYPFTAQEYWGKIIRLVRLSEGHVTKSETENIFHIKLKKAVPQGLGNIELEKAQAGGAQYHVYPGKDWYFNIQLLVLDSKNSQIFFSWGEDPHTRPPNQEMCIDARSAALDLERLGWENIFKFREQDVDWWDRYERKDGAFLNIAFDKKTDCVVNLMLGVNGWKK